MKTKLEIVKKRQETSQQLDFVESISSADKIHRKRLFLLISIFATIGLSLLFWGYRFAKEFIASPQKFFAQITFSLPDLRFKRSTSPSLSSAVDDQISEILARETVKWNISVHVIGGGLDNFNWSKNTKILSASDFDTVINELSVKKASPDSIITSLPQGTKIQEIIIDNANIFNLQSLVTVPGKKILFVIGVEGSNLSKIKPQLLNLMANLYWTIIQADSSN